MSGWGQRGWLGTEGLLGDSGAGWWLPKPLGWGGMEARTGLDAGGSSRGHHLLTAAVTCPIQQPISGPPPCPCPHLLGLPGLCSPLAGSARLLHLCLLFIPQV